MYSVDIPNFNRLPENFMMFDRSKPLQKYFLPKLDVDEYFKESAYVQLQTLIIVKQLITGKLQK